jgi:release factor glutamine methyltransferase
VIAVSSVRDAVASAAAALEAAGCETPRLDAELLIADALGVGREAIVAEPERAVPASATRLIGQRIERRIMREPVAYIIGRRGFRRIELMVDRRVLIPRPETELLVEPALALPRGASVHEVGTGSGAVVLALGHERPDLRLSASDASAAAIDVASANAATLGIELELSVAHGLPKGTFELVLANLPYVREAEWSGLQPEITRYEPREALVGGEDGLDAIRSLLADPPACEAIALEIGEGQADEVERMVGEAGFEERERRRDLAGIDRVVLGRRA